MRRLLVPVVVSATVLLILEGSAPASAAPGCEPPSAGRVALWRADGTAQDSAGTNDAALNGEAAYGAGILGQAFSLPGDQDHLTVPDSAELNPPGDLTLDAWVKIGDTDFAVGGDRAIFFKSDAADQELTYALWIEGSDVTAEAAPLTFAGGSRALPGSHAYSDPLAWQAGQWYHLAAVRSGNEISFYRDGHPVGTDMLGQAAIATPGSPLALGAAPVSGTVYNPLKGALDEAEIWNRALSAGEIASIHDTATGNCDTTPPQTRITAGPAEGEQIKGTPTFEFESSKPNSTFRCYVTYPPGTIVPVRSFDCNSPTKLSLGADGPYTFRVYATDAAGNTDPAGDRRSFRLLPPPPRNTKLPFIHGVLGQPHTYQCNTGDWEGLDPSAPLKVSWQRLTPDSSYISGYRVDTVATGLSYRASAAQKSQLAGLSWLFQCVVEASNVGGSTSATSASRVLDPVYDATGSRAPYGNLRIRGIDVFQVVQPSAGARAFGYTISPVPPYHEIPAGDPSQIFGFDMAGGGTPTSYRRTYFGGELRPGANPQRTGYVGVPLDETKPATAVVYVDDADGVPAGQAAQKLEVTLSARRNGKPWDSPIPQMINFPPQATPAYVTSAERGNTQYGVQFQIPPYWFVPPASGDRLDLEAHVGFQPGFGSDTIRPPYQCTAADCSGDDHFRLDDLPVTTMPRVRIQSVEMREASDRWNTTPQAALKRVTEVFPGGERMFIFSSGAFIPINDITHWTIDSDQCKPWKDTEDGLRFCRLHYIDERLNEWEARDKAYGSLYDVLFGMHDYGGEPGEAEGPSLASWPSAGRHPTFNANQGSFDPKDQDVVDGTTRDDSLHRPLTAAAHELGHILGLPHAGHNCPVPVGYNANQTGPGAGQAGEDWPGEDRGRLQGVQFDRTSTPNLGRIVPQVDSGADPAPPSVTYQYLPGIGQVRVEGSQNPDPAGSLLDLMSYCPFEGLSPDRAGNLVYRTNAWMSARNWNHTFRVLRDFRDRIGAASRAAGAAGAGAAFAVGVVGPHGGRIERIVPPENGSQAPAPAPSSRVRLRARDATGKLLGEAGVAVPGMSEAPRSSGGSFIGPVPRGAATVELVRDGTLLDSLKRTRLPRVRVRAPLAGQRVHGRRNSALAVRWSASDPDGDALHATVEYSADGGRRWTTMYQGPSEGRLRIPGHSLAGSRRARIRVDVSDGFNETRASSGIFRADGTPPKVRISRPQKGESLATRARTLLIGSALDDRHRELSGRSLSWFAGGHRLGRGKRLAAKLPAGRYSLRLVAHDHGGRAGVARLKVHVGRPALQLLRISYQRAVPRRASKLTVGLAASENVILRAAGRRYHVGPRTRRIVLPLPPRPKAGVLRIPAVLMARDGRHLAGTIVLRRG
jgi:Concanavalin A-like lectin/glucanases superfamily